MDDKQLRVCLAHELGHLFFIEMLNDGQKEGEKTFTPATLTELISSILVIFTSVPDTPRSDLQYIRHKIGCAP
jgi:hypothetical protein